MKWIKQTRLTLVLCLALTGWGQAAVVEKPTVMPDAMLSITASDVHGLIDGVGSVAAQISPMMNGMMLKNMIGVQLGDPNLAGIEPGKGLAIIALDQTNAFAVVEVSATQLATYTNACAAKGMLTNYKDGLLIVGKTDAQVAKGATLSTTVKEKLLAKRSPTLRISLQPAALIAKNDAQIQGMLQMMPMMLGMSMQQAPGMDPAAMQSMTRFLEGEVRVLLALAKQCESFEVVLAPQNGSLRIVETIAPKEGTRLAMLLNAPKVEKPNPQIQSGVLGAAAVAIDCTMGNPEAFVTFTMAEVEQVIKEMNLQVDDLAGLLDTMKKWMGLYSGSFCETVDLSADSGFAVSYLLEVKNADSVLSMFKTIKEDMAPFFKLYEDFGMPMSADFKENAREYKGIDIHRFKVEMSLDQMTEEQRAQMAAMNLTNIVYDVALLDGKLIYTMGTSKIEKVIDRLKDPEFNVTPLKARGIYPEGGFYYCDFDLAKYLSFVSSLMPEEAKQSMAQTAILLQGAEPVTSAGFCEEGCVMWSVNVPGSLIQKISQAAMMMQMQSMQNASGGPVE